MQKFIIRLSLFGLAVALLAPIFPPLALLIPPLGLAFIACALIACLALVRDLLAAVFRWRRIT